MTSNKEEKLKNYRFIITKLDEFRAFRRSNPEYLLGPASKCGTSQIIEKIKPDLERIAQFPETLPDVTKFLRAVVVLRKLLPLCMFSMILALLIRAGIFKITNSIIFYLLIIVPIVVLFLFVVVDQFVRRKIARAEEDNPDLHREEKENIKQAIDEITNRMYRQLGIKREEAEKHKMNLYFDDYKGVVVKNKYRERVMFIFKKKYSRFVSIFRT